MEWTAGALRTRNGHLARIFRIIAEGTRPHAAETLTWLVDQDPYAKTYKKDHAYYMTWRSHLAYQAFQYIQDPPEVLMEFYRKKLADKTLAGPLKHEIAEALAAHGTPESVRLLELHEGGRKLLVQLIRHRDNFECVRLFLSRYRKATVAKAVRKRLKMLLVDKTCSITPMETPQALPKIAPQGEEADKFLELFNGFLKDHGKIPLTEAETRRIEELIDEIENGVPRPEEAVDPGVPAGCLEIDDGCHSPFDWSAQTGHLFFGRPY